MSRQFYALSKTHHPDHNPDDPDAGERFMKLSEAYAILGTPHRRERYDQDLQRSKTPNPQPHRGSYSSAASPYGARPASGLSRRRGQFRGPPPSFYRSGGWGIHSEKRQAQAKATARAHAESAAASQGGGMGYGQGQAGFNNDVPHFDQRAHFRTQQQQEQRRKQRMRANAVAFEEGGGMIMRFLLLSGVVAVACFPFVLFRAPHLVTTQGINKGQK